MCRMPYKAQRGWQHVSNWKFTFPSVLSGTTSSPTDFLLLLQNDTPAYAGDVTPPRGVQKHGANLRVESKFRICWICVLTTKKYFFLNSDWTPYRHAPCSIMSPWADETLSPPNMGQLSALAHCPSPLVPGMRFWCLASHLSAHRVTKQFPGNSEM